MSMQIQITPKGALYSADCTRCGATLLTHEWAHDDHNDRRDALETGTLRCDDCGGTADPKTFARWPRRWYAGRYSAPGYLDCTEWHYGANRQQLIRDLRAMYGDDNDSDSTAPELSPTAHCDQWGSHMGARLVRGMSAAEREAVRRGEPLYIAGPTNGGRLPAYRRVIARGALFVARLPS